MEATKRNIKDRAAEKTGGIVINSTVRAGDQAMSFIEFMDSSLEFKSAVSDVAREKFGNYTYDAAKKRDVDAAKIRLRATFGLLVHPSAINLHLNQEQILNLAEGLRKAVMIDGSKERLAITFDGDRLRDMAGYINGLAILNEML